MESECALGCSCSCVSETSFPPQDSLKGGLSDGLSLTSAGSPSTPSIFSSPCKPLPVLNTKQTEDPFSQDHRPWNSIHPIFLSSQTAHKDNPCSRSHTVGLPPGSARSESGPVSGGAPVTMTVAAGWSPWDPPSLYHVSWVGALPSRWLCNSSQLGTRGPTRGLCQWRVGLSSTPH